MITELNFEKISKTVTKLDSERSKRQPVNLSETSRDTFGAHQRAADSLQFLMFLLFATVRPLKCNERLIDGLFHSGCLDFHASEKIFIWKLALSE